MVSGDVFPPKQPCVINKPTSPGSLAQINRIIIKKGGIHYSLLHGPKEFEIKLISGIIEWHYCQAYL